MEKVLLCYQNKRGQNTRDKMPKNQTERQTTDMTENRIKEEEKEGGFQFLSAGLFSLSFFLFQLCFRKKNKLLSNERFFFKGGFVQITCAISLHLGARALSSDDTLPERERER